MTPVPGTVAVCQKWVDRRPEVDALTGAVRTDARTRGPSAADQAALEWGLRAADLWGSGVLVVTAGPVGADGMLRDALAAGASRVVRTDLEIASSSRDVAAALAGIVDGAALVLCGDWSLDRGSGSVPAYLAGHLGAASALGCTSLLLDPEQPGALRPERRLDGGRREILATRGPVVVSVEGGSARLRRAPLAGVLATREARIEVVAAPRPGSLPLLPVRTGPYRPRPRRRPPPSVDLSARQRIAALSGVLDQPTPPQLLVLDPAAAAERIIEQLRAWGYLP